MLRKHENTDSWKAGGLAIAVHVLLLGAMLVSFNWKAAHPALNVTEVELWDKLPSTKPIAQTIPKPEPKPIIEEKPEPKPEPIIEKKPEPEQPKVDIALENKKKELEKQAKIELEKKKKTELERKIAQQMREEDLQDNKAAEKQANIDREKLNKIQQDILNENSGADTKTASAANASIIGEYTEKIKAKIRGNVNKTLCGDGNPELRFDIGLLPTGELSGPPKLVKSSGSAACDDAVERAIAASQPLPLPTDPAIYAKFRSLNLRFKPNE